MIAEGGYFCIHEAISKVHLVSLAESKVMLPEENVRKNVQERKISSINLLTLNHL